MHAGGPWHFDLPAMEGIITDAIVSHSIWPSCSHTRFAVLAWSALGIAGLNALMLLSMPPIGGHYLADMIVGGASPCSSCSAHDGCLYWTRRSRLALDDQVDAPQAAARCPDAGLPAAPSPADPSSHPYAAASASAAAVPRRGHRGVVDRRRVHAELVEQRRLTALHSAASPTCSGTIWLSDASTGSSAARSRRFNVSARSNSAARRPASPRTCRTLASAAAAIIGGSEVVKMKPGAQERT